jgi:hypothetical protein
MKSQISPKISDQYYHNSVGEVRRKFQVLEGKIVTKQVLLSALVKARYSVPMLDQEIVDCLQDDHKIRTKLLQSISSTPIVATTTVGERTSRGGASGGWRS